MGKIFESKRNSLRAPTIFVLISSFVLRKSKAGKEGIAFMILWDFMRNARVRKTKVVLDVG